MEADIGTFCVIAVGAQGGTGWAPPKEYISIKNTKQLLCVFIPGTFILESRNKNYSAPIGSMGNYLLSTESFM